jgi:protein phosphatase 1L
MEDAHSVGYDERSGVFFAEVFDGHSGSLAAVNAARVLGPSFYGTAEAAENIGRPSAEFTAEALREAYLATDRYIATLGSESGTAAATLYLRECDFLAANAGDARIVLGDGRKAITLTMDHKPDLPEEQSRIEALGGTVLFLDVPRVQGSLAMSRALGDPLLKPLVTPEPRIAEGTLGRRCNSAIIACDGLWDVVTPEEAIALAYNVSEPQETADRLLALAVAKGSTDNVTVVVLDLRVHASPCHSRHLHITRVLDRAS